MLRQSQANTIAISNRVRDQLELIRPTCRPAWRSRSAPTTRCSSTQSIREVVRALAIAVVLVVLVIFAVPGLAARDAGAGGDHPGRGDRRLHRHLALGFSINVLTLLALILAIGIVVDDAIVVLENVQRRIELGETPLVAGVLGTRQVTFAVIATSLTLIAVFVPISFLEGQVGRLFTEFGFVLAPRSRSRCWSR